MRDSFFSHGDMHQGISFVQEIIVATVDVPPDYLAPVLRLRLSLVGHGIDQFQGTVLKIPGFYLFFGTCL
jgi:hypothetical protein